MIAHINQSFYHMLNWISQGSRMAQIQQCLEENLAICRQLARHKITFEVIELQKIAQWKVFFLLFIFIKFNAEKFL